MVRAQTAVLKGFPQQRGLTAAVVVVDVGVIAKSTSSNEKIQISGKNSKNSSCCVVVVLWANECVFKISADQKSFFRSSLVTDNSCSFVFDSQFFMKDGRYRNYTNGLSDEGQRMAFTPNAGGSSEASEVLSFEILRNAFGAKLLKTETELQYFDSVFGYRGSKITDYAVEMFGETVGVSVTRAIYLGRKQKISPFDHAVSLLEKKLLGIIKSTENVINISWKKQLLHIFVDNEETKSIMTSAFQHVSSQLKSNTIVLITVSNSAECIFHHHRQRSVVVSTPQLLA